MPALKIGQWEAKLGVGMEATYGALGTIARLVPTESMAFDYKQDGVVQTEFGVSRTATNAYKREAVLTPSLTMSVQPNSVGEIFASAFGTFTSGTNLAAAGTQYKHTFVPINKTSDDFRSIQFKVDHGQGSVHDYFGNRCNQFTLSCAAKENLKLSADFIGQREVAGTSAPVTITYGSYNPPFEFKDAIVKIDGTVCDGLRALELTYNNGLSDGFRLGTQAFTTRPLPGAALDINFKMSCEYDEVNRARYEGGSTVGITINFVGGVISGTGKYELMCRLPAVNYLTAPFEYQDGLMHLALGGKAFEGGTSFAGTSYALQMELFNNVNAI